MRTMGQRPLADAWIFVSLVLGLSLLVFWGPLALFGITTISFVSEERGPIWAIVLFMIGGFAPSIVGVVLARLRGGKEELRRLMKKLIDVRLGARWYVAIVATVALTTLSQIGLNRLLGNRFDFGLFVAQLPSLLPLIVIGPLSEELGWRGFLLSRLQAKLGALYSSIVVGIAWAVWHLPLFAIPGTSQRELGLPFFGFLIGLVAISIIMTWFHNNTRGSVWTAVVFHWLYTYAAQVTATGVNRGSVYNWLEYLPFVAIAVILLIARPSLGLRRADDGSQSRRFPGNDADG